MSDSLKALDFSQPFARVQGYNRTWLEQAGQKFSEDGWPLDVPRDAAPAPKDLTLSDPGNDQSGPCLDQKAAPAPAPSEPPTPASQAPAAAATDASAAPAAPACEPAASAPAPADAQPGSPSPAQADAAPAAA